MEDYLLSVGKELCMECEVLDGGQLPWESSNGNENRQEEEAACSQAESSNKVCWIEEDGSCQEVVHDSALYEVRCLVRLVQENAILVSSDIIEAIMVVSLGIVLDKTASEPPNKRVLQQRIVTKLVIGRVLVDSDIIQAIVFVDGPSSCYPLM